MQLFFKEGRILYAKIAIRKYLLEKGWINKDIKIFYGKEIASKILEC